MDVSERQLTTLGALCDTWIPAVAPPAVEQDDPTGFWARRGTDLDVHRKLAEELGHRLTDDEQADVRTLLDVLGRTGVARLPVGMRRRALDALATVDADARAGILGLRALSLHLFYGSVDASGTNPNWRQTGYAGPPATTSTAAAPIVTRPDPGDVHWTADAVIVGSGSGGGVIAGELAAAGLDVVVLEAGGAPADADFPRDEQGALSQLYWQRGLTPTEEGTIAILAGATLGGGSTINWQNCVTPPDGVRATWAQEHGLAGVDGPDFDDHLEAVAERIGATDRHSVLNGPNQRLSEGADALGLSWHLARRNAADHDDPATAGHVGYGDRSGAKQGVLKTYLADAAGDGARILVGCRVERVTTADGRATGVTGTLADGRTVRVDAPVVVVAAGALETPGILLRSGVGGPAVGRHLRLHPVPMLVGVYAEDQRAWWGPPQAAIVDHHTDVNEGHGYLVETAHYHPGVTAMAIPWQDGRQHKLVMGRMSDLAAFIAVQRDHGSGRVVLDDHGRTKVQYPWVDAIDQQVLEHAITTMARLHEAAGAKAVLDLHASLQLWRRGESLDDWLQGVVRQPVGAGERTLFSAHQMGSARMGTSSQTSVADPEGQLHDVRGAWIGDTSAFPTAVGSNPMLTCMALARRTAHAILASR